MRPLHLERTTRGGLEILMEWDRRRPIVSLVGTVIIRPGKPRPPRENLGISRPRAQAVEGRALALQAIRWRSTLGPAMSLMCLVYDIVIAKALSIEASAIRRLSHRASSYGCVAAIPGDRISRRPPSMPSFRSGASRANLPMPCGACPDRLDCRGSSNSRSGESCLRENCFGAV